MILWYDCSVSDLNTIDLSGGIFLSSYIEKIKALNEKREAPPLAHIHNYGCQLNVTDGEKLKGLLLNMGYGITEIPEQADLVIFNTCAVRENAEERVFGNLGFLKQYKEKNKEMIICVCGCMTEQSCIVEKIKSSYKYVDIVFGTNAFDKFPSYVYNIIEGQKRVYDTSGPDETIHEGLTQVRSCKFKASVPIMYGCNNFCTYCIVPYVRGRERSRAPELILDEVRSLVNDGCKEIMLLGQNVNSYGNDLDKDINFPWLLRQINAIEGDFIIRFMSSHPKDASKELIDAIYECEKVGKHLHLPVQSGNDDVLNRMNRKYTAQKYLEIISYAREKMPDFSFSSDILIGFPNETEEEFLDTLDIVKKVRYSNIYSFIYSKRTGTKAALIDDKITYEEKQGRMQRLLDLQREITTEDYKKLVGKKLRVLVEANGKGGEGTLTGKSSEFVIVNFDGDSSLIGTFVNVEVTGARNWAVDGKICTT